MKKIAIIVAMEAEASKLIQELNFQKIASIEPKLSIEAFQTTYKNLNIHLVLNGKDKTHQVDSIGPMTSTLTAYLTLKNFQPDLLLNTGTCGAFKSKDASIAKVYLCNEFCSHDGRVSIPGFKEYGTNATKFEQPEINKILSLSNLEQAVVSTGNSLDISTEDLSRLEKHEKVVKEMEAASIAYVAKQFETPFLALKSVTDLIDGGGLAQEEFLKNLQRSSEKLYKETLKLLDLINEN